MHHLLSDLCPSVTSRGSRHLSLSAAATSLQIFPSLPTLLTLTCQLQRHWTVGRRLLMESASLSSGSCEGAWYCQILLHFLSVSGLT